MKKTTQYHHGALKEALLTGAEALLKRQGLNALTLRAAAREAGVSHAAPAHHFGDLTGLLTELAAVGYNRLSQCLQRALEASSVKRWDGSRAYVAFAAENPALFQLMFRSDRLDATNPALREARVKALTYLADSRQVHVPDTSVEHLGKILAGWSLIHGYSLLLLDGRLKGIQNIGPGGTTAEQLFEAMLTAVDNDELGPP